MECQGVLIARSVHSVSASGGMTLVRVLNPSNAPITVYRDEKLGVLQPLSISLESAALEEADPYPQSHSEEAKQAVRQLQSRAQGLSEAESTVLETLLFNFPMSSLSTVATWEGPRLCATELTLRELQSEVTYLNFSSPNTSVIRTRLAKPHPLFPATFVDPKLFKWPTSSVSGLALPVV